MNLEDSIALQTTANGSKIVRLPARQILKLVDDLEAARRDLARARRRLAEAEARADQRWLGAEAWRRHCAKQKDRRELDALARAIKAQDQRKDRV